MEVARREVKELPVHLQQYVEHDSRCYILMFLLQKNPQKPTNILDYRSYNTDICTCKNATIFAEECVSSDQLCLLYSEVKIRHSLRQYLGHVLWCSLCGLMQWLCCCSCWWASVRAVTHQLQDFCVLFPICPIFYILFVTEAFLLVFIAVFLYKR